MSSFHFLSVIKLRRLALSPLLFENLCSVQDTTLSTTRAHPVGDRARPTPCGIIYCHKIATCEAVARRLTYDSVQLWCWLLLYHILNKLSLSLHAIIRRYSVVFTRHFYLRIRSLPSDYLVYMGVRLCGFTAAAFHSKAKNRDDMLTSWLQNRSLLHTLLNQTELMWSVLIDLASWWCSCSWHYGGHDRVRDGYR